MPYKLLFEAKTVQDLRNAIPSVGELPDGTKGRFEISGPGLGLLADLAGAELIWQAQLAQAGVALVDVYGEGFSLAIVDWVVDSSLTQAQGGVQQGQVQVVVLPVLLIIAAVIAVLLALNWVINSIKAFFEEIVEHLPGIVLAALIIGGLVLGAIALSSRKGATVST